MNPMSDSPDLLVMFGITVVCFLIPTILFLYWDARKKSKMTSKLTEQQRNCKHTWDPEHDGLDYAACLSCGVMIHRKDGDLINPE